MKRFSEIINEQFWNIAFKTGVYDLSVMSSYDHSLESITKLANITSKCKILDVGCGSGRQLEFINERLIQTDSQWTGLELTSGGFNACKRRIYNMGLEKFAGVLQADMTKPLPVENESIDIAIAHFSLYVIPEKAGRIAAFNNIADTLKGGGKFYIALPAKNYNARDQVRSSLSINRNNPNITFIRKQWNQLKFPTIGLMSEIAVTKRIHDGVWSSFTKDEIEHEASEAGFKMDWLKSTYGDTSLMAAFSK